MEKISIPERSQGPSSSPEPHISKYSSQYEKLQSIGLSHPQYSANFTHLLYQIGLKLMKENQAKVSPPEPPPNITRSESTVISLSSQKRTKPKDKSKKKINKKKQRSGDLYYEKSYSLRRSSSTFLEPPRNIHTPDWEDYHIIRHSNEVVDMDKYDIVNIHGRIEIYESRIQQCEDSAHPHPALARVAADEAENNDKFTDAEQQKFTRYQIQNVTQKIPLFWPKRSYDTEDNTMSEEQTQAMSQKIQKEMDYIRDPKLNSKKKTNSKSNSSSVAKVPRPKKTTSDRPKKVGRPPKLSTIIDLTSTNYITDDEDLTDFDF